MGFIKTISLSDDMKPFLEKMRIEGINFSAWVCQKVREYDDKNTYFEETEKKIAERLKTGEVTETLTEKPKQEFVDLLKTMSKEELEATISEPTMDETVKTFAKVFLKKLST